MDLVARALQERRRTGDPPYARTRQLAAGDGWTVNDVVCTAGPRDRPFEEKHQYVAIAAVITGSFQYRSLRGTHVMSPGSVLLGSAEQEFRCSHEHGCRDRCISFHYDPVFYEQVVSNVNGQFRFPIAQLPALEPLTPIFAQAEAGAAGHPVAFDELAVRFAANVANVFRAHVPRPASAQDRRRISESIRWIESSFQNPLTLASLAAMAGVSQYHYLRTFRQVTGLTPHQFILRFRLRKAGVGLQVTNEPITQIALENGFNDLSNFNTLFRRHYGASPANYRNS